MARTTSIFELVYTDTAHIISINIDSATGFMDFITLLSDQCIYIQNAEKPNITFIATYIDDLLIIG